MHKIVNKNDLGGVYDTTQIYARRQARENHEIDDTQSKAWLFRMTSYVRKLIQIDFDGL